MTHLHPGSLAIVDGLHRAEVVTVGAAGQCTVRVLPERGESYIVAAVWDQDTFSATDSLPLLVSQEL